MLQPRQMILPAIILAVVTIGFSFVLNDVRKQEFYAIILAMIPAIYLGFALMDERPRQMLLEVTVGSAFAAMAFLGLWVSAWFLVAGYLLHAGWDMLHHSKGIQTRIVAWYPPACAVYDAIVGIYLVVWLLRF